MRKASWLLRNHDDIMLLADRGFAHQGLLKWLNKRTWHYCLGIPSDTLIHGVYRWRAYVSQLQTVKGEAKMYHQVRLWESRIEKVNLAHVYPTGAAEPWTVITYKTPTLQTFWQYGLRFRVEELFLDSKSGVFGLADSRLRTRCGYRSVRCFASYRAEADYYERLLFSRVRSLKCSV